MKKLLKISLPIILLVALFYVVQNKNDYTGSNEGEKSVQINIFIRDGEELEEVHGSIGTHTDAATLGDLIDEINGTTVDFELDGDKDSEFGRFIVGIEDVKTEDMNKGPWWMLYSENNKDCEEAGFCNGIDSQLIYDEDIFDFVFE